MFFPAIAGLAPAAADRPALDQVPHFPALAGAGIVLVAALFLAALPATAAPLLALKCQHLPVEGPNVPGLDKSQAEQMARSAWELKVTHVHGESWAHFGKAMSKSYLCAAKKKGWTCHLAARPCRHVAPVTPSAAPPRLPGAAAAWPAARRPMARGEPGPGFDPLAGNRRLIMRRGR